jgi:4-hydroxybenzoate polyprenyltransferase
MRSALMVWREARPIVQVLYLLRFVVGGAVGIAAAGVSPSVSGIVLGAVAAVGASLYVYLLNGMTDLAGDRANGSRRPLATGALSVPTARVWLVALLVVGLAAGFAVSVPVGVINAVNIVLGTLYSVGPRAAKTEALAASGVIGVGGFLAYLVGASAWAGTIAPQAVATSAVLGLWMGVAGNTKDFDDAVGDAQAGRHTLPVVLGGRRAGLVIGTAALIAGAAAIAAVVLGLGSPALVLLAPFAAALAWRCFGAEAKRGRSYTVFMLSQLITYPAVLAWSLVSFALR